MMTSRKRIFPWAWAVSSTREYVVVYRIRRAINSSRLSSVLPWINKKTNSKQQNTDKIQDAGFILSTEQMAIATTRPTAIPWAYTVLLVLIGISILVTFLMNSKIQVENETFTAAEINTLRTHHTRTHTNNKPPISIGRQIVEHAFNESYVDLRLIPSTNGDEQKHLVHMRQLYQLRGNTNLEYGQKWPWWFQTLLRDIATKHTGGALHGDWHQLYFPSPANLNLCVFEKGGTKEWRKLHCKFLHNDTNVVKNMSAVEMSRCYQDSMHKEDEPTSSLSSPRVVFLRDPLERFLSGFIDKCVRENKGEPRPAKHCEPLPVFAKGSKMVDGFIEKAQSSDARKLFEIYVDAFPLSWNLHFIPQSLFCGGLNVELPNYDFVGNMGDTFYQHLKRLGDRFPALQPYLEDQFRLKTKGGIHSNKGVETKAANQTEYFYTPKTVRRVLEYMSVDYVTLGLEIPRWADEMLSKDYYNA